MKNANRSSRDHDRMWSVADAADFLGVSRAFMYREVNAKRISVYRLRGQTIRIAVEDLNEYLERHHSRSLSESKPNKRHF